MKRFNVVTQNGTMRLYYPSIQEAKVAYPDAIISENADTSFLSYVEKIHSLSTDNLLNYHGGQVWKIPYHNSHILYRQFMDEDEYIDGCEYQRHDNVGYTEPIMWNMSTPQEFYERFLCEEHIELPIEVISFKEIKQLKAKKFWNKNNKAYWYDSNGYFYCADKCDLPNKNKKDDWAKFGGNKEAIFVGYGTEIALRKYEWFESKAVFDAFWNEHIKEHNPAYGTLQYEIKRKGYYTLAPEDRRVIFRLPWFDVNKERGNTHEIARTWCKLMTQKQFGNWHDNIDAIEDVVKKYLENT